MIFAMTETANQKPSRQLQLQLGMFGGSNLRLAVFGRCWGDGALREEVRFGRQVKLRMTMREGEAQGRRDAQAAKRSV